MYIPSYYKLEDKDEVVSFIRKYNFAPIVTSNNGHPQATHIPFHISEKDGVISFTAHMARANKHWQDFDEQEVLIIFSGPHAYISPSFYEKEQNVPTWNYLAVHVYGKAHVVKDEARGYEILNELTQQSEPEYLKQWERLDNKYREGLFKGIVAFEVEVKEIQAKHKMSQNKTANERRNIIEGLSREEDTAIKETARYMEHNEGKF